MPGIHFESISHSLVSHLRGRRNSGVSVFTASQIALCCRVFFPSRVAESIMQSFSSMSSVLIPAPAIDSLTGQSNDSILGLSINQSIHSMMWMHLVMILLFGMMPLMILLSCLLLLLPSNQYNLPSFLVVLIRIRSCYSCRSSILIACIALVVVDILVFLYYENTLTRWFSFRVGCSTECTQYLFLDPSSLSRILLLDTTSLSYSL